VRLGQWGRVGLLTLVAGCLWVGPAEHDARKALVATELSEVVLEPEIWSACLPPSESLAVTATVSPASPELPFRGWIATAEERVYLGEARAQPVGDRAELAFTLLPSEVWPPCPEGCFPTFRFGVERAGLEEGIDVLFEILPVQTPLVHNATVLDSAGAPTSLDNLERLDDPAFGIPVGPWPTLVVELSDPHLPAGPAHHGLAGGRGHGRHDLPYGHASAGRGHLRGGGGRHLARRPGGRAVRRGDGTRLRDRPSDAAVGEPPALRGRGLRRLALTPRRNERSRSIAIYAGARRYRWTFPTAGPSRSAGSSG
jgi:hypothetical protein